MSLGSLPATSSTQPTSNLLHAARPCARAGVGTGIKTQGFPTPPWPCPDLGAASLHFPHTQRTVDQEPGLWTGWDGAVGPSPLSQDKEASAESGHGQTSQELHGSCDRFEGLPGTEGSLRGVRCEVEMSVPSHSQGCPP